MRARPLLRNALGALFGVLVALAAANGAASPVQAAPDPGGSQGLIPIPPGCPVPDPADVAFVGEVVDKDGFIEKGTVRYRIEQIRAGDASPFSVDGLIDVRYGPDSKYLDIGERYFVAAAVDPEIGQLASRVDEEQPLFGGDAVIGIDDTAVECPEIDDPVQTLEVDGTPIETGLLDPLFEDRRLLLATIAVPAAIVGAVLIGLVILRRLVDLGAAGVFNLGRAAVTPTADRRAARVRTHAPADPDRHREPLIGGGRVGTAFQRVGTATSDARERVQTTVRAATQRLQEGTVGVSDEPAGDDDGGRTGDGGEPAAAEPESADANR